MAYALAHDRTDLLPALTSIAFPNRYDGGQEPIFEYGAVRHAAIFGSGAGETFESARNLFMASELRTEMPYLRRDQDFDAALSEAELISAMCLADRRAGARSTYCHVIGAEGAAERRLRARVRHESVNDLALIFEVEPAKLTEALNELYATLQGDGMWAKPSWAADPREGVVGHQQGGDCLSAGEIAAWEALQGFPESRGDLRAVLSGPTAGGLLMRAAPDSRIPRTLSSRAESER